MPKKELTVERLRELLDYDHGTGVFNWRKTHSGVRGGSLAGKTTSAGYRQIGVDRRAYLAHRLAWLYMTGEWPSCQVDHIDGDRMDNRWSNLRLVTHGQNAQNCRMYRNNSVGLKGVSPKDGKFVAQIRLNNRVTYLGRFDTAAEAHAAYCNASAQMHGDFGRTK